MSKSSHPKKMAAATLTVALVHHPIIDKNGELVTTSVTNLDVHDIARTCRTFGVDRYLLVTPVDSQIHLINRIMDHWKDGWGSRYNPARKEALSRVGRVSTLDELLEETRHAKAETLVVATSAREVDDVPRVSMDDLAADPRHLVLVFGTGWGLHPDALSKCDAVLPPIVGPDAYNHLPVRAAVAIYLAGLNGSIGS